MALGNTVIPRCRARARPCASTARHLRRRAPARGPRGISPTRRKCRCRGPTRSPPSRYRYSTAQIITVLGLLVLIKTHILETDEITRFGGSYGTHLDCTLACLSFWRRRLLRLSQVALRTLSAVSPTFPADKLKCAWTRC